MASPATRATRLGVLVLLYTLNSLHLADALPVRFGFNFRGLSGAYGYDWDYWNQTVAPEPQEP